MSYQAVRAVLESPQPKGLHRLVKIVLAEHANGEFWSWPAVKTIAKEASIGLRSVGYIIQKLQKTGHIEIEEGGGRRKTNRYRILFPNPATTMAGFNNKRNHQNPATVSKEHPAK
jgi:hypothetical protein